MHSEDLPQTKDETKEKIRLVAAPDGPAVENESRSAQNPSPDLTQPVTYSTDPQKILKELPEDDFLRFLDQSSPEQLQSFLQGLTPSRQPFFHALQNLFTPVIAIPDEPRDAFSIIAWWEARRFLFNLVVGLCGLPTLAIIYFLGLAHESIIISGTIEYGFLANICYTAGWMAELIARSWWKERARHLGPILFTLGFAFSVLLTLAAGAIAIFVFLAICLGRSWIL